MLRNYNYRGRYLPHIQKDNRSLFVTFATYHRWRLPDIARDLALEACVHTNNRKCILQAAVIMPDHVHLILAPLADEEGSFSIPQIMHAIKSESAHRINKALERKGKVWQDESFDKLLRGDESLASRMAYVLENPVRAGLVKTVVDYRWLWQQAEPILQTAELRGRVARVHTSHPNPETRPTVLLCFPKTHMKAIDRTRLTSLTQREQQRFVKERPKSKALFERAGKSLLGGVPMNWMIKWAGAFPPFVREAQGAHFYDVDGLRYVDFCLGDTGAMTGHSPFATVKAVEEQMKRGITLMLPSEDAIFVAEELQQRFGLPFWQFALTATDANRFAIRLARQITQRPKILVFNWCYHGTVDESFITLKDGVAQARRGNIGPPVDPTITTKVVEFNDVAALEQAVAPGDVACVLAEPVMTNVGIVHPEPGYHHALRELTEKSGTLLIIDETHTICAGPGGYTRAENLDPDFFIFGKAIAGGVPGAAYGFTEAVANSIARSQNLEDCDTGGIGGTLAGNALSLAAMRATLTKVLTKDAFARMIPAAERWTAGVEKAIAEFGVPWHVTRLGCRAEYQFSPTPPRNGAQAHDDMDFELERFMHLHAMNRGILLTPFHNMALMSPQTDTADVDQHTRVFREAVKELVA